MSNRLLWVQKLTVIPWCCSRPLCPHTERQERNHVNYHLVDFQLQSWAWSDRRVSCQWDVVLEWINRMPGLHCLPTILKRVVIMESMHDFRGHTTGEQDKQNYFLSLLFVLLIIIIIWISLKNLLVENHFVNYFIWVQISLLKFAILIWDVSILISHKTTT